MNKKKLKNKINLSMPKLNKQHALLAVTLLISTLTIFLNNGLRNSEFEDRVVVEYVNEDALEELKSVGSYMSIDRKNMQIL